MVNSINHHPRQHHHGCLLRQTATEGGVGHGVGAGVAS